MHWIIALVVLSVQQPAQAQVSGSNSFVATQSVSQSTGLPRGPVAGPEQNGLLDPSKPSFWSQTFVTVLVSIVTAILTGWFQEQRRRGQLLEKEFSDCVGDVRELSEEILDDVVKHLTAQPFSGPAQRKSQAEILLNLKQCARRMTRTGKMLENGDSTKLEAEFLKWKSELTGEPFPVSKKERICLLHDAAVSKVQTAHDHWIEHLDSLRRSSINGTLKVPLNPKS